VRAPKASWNRGGSEGQDQMVVKSSEVAVTE
jgi:hypothetical protein